MTNILNKRVLDVAVLERARNWYNNCGIERRLITVVDSDALSMVLARRSMNDIEINPTNLVLNHALVLLCP